MSNSTLKPFAVSLHETERLTAKSRSSIYEAIGRGELVAVKDAGRTLITLKSIERRQAALPRAFIKAPKPRKDGAVR